MPNNKKNNNNKSVKVKKTNKKSKNSNRVKLKDKYPKLMLAIKIIWTFWK